jgi:hypothetical protein
MTGTVHITTTMTVVIGTKVVVEVEVDKVSDDGTIIWIT